MVGMGRIARGVEVDLLKGYVLVAARRLHQPRSHSVGVRERGKEIVERAILLNDDDNVLNRTGTRTGSRTGTRTDTRTCGRSAARLGRDTLGCRRLGGAVETSRTVRARGK